ncbi:MAG: Trm112 family protein [Anaerolineae bacterium]
MKKLMMFLGLVLGAVAAALIVRKMVCPTDSLPLPATQRNDSVDVPAFDESELGGQVSPELLSILVSPDDKGPLTLSSDGKWLINPRNGYRYPIRRGIPVMLIEEGRRNQDVSLITQSA